MGGGGVVVGVSLLVELEGQLTAMTAQMEQLKVL